MSITVFKTQSTMTVEELVKTVQPKAFVHDDGTMVYIRVREEHRYHCDQCERDYIRQKLPFECPVIGQGGTAEAAWQDAVVNLGMRR